MTLHHLAIDSTRSMSHMTFYFGIHNDKMEIRTTGRPNEYLKYLYKCIMSYDYYVLLLI